MMRYIASLDHEAPSEKRLIIDLAALRQIIAAEGAIWGGALKGPQASCLGADHFSVIADILTKVLADVNRWWEASSLPALPFRISMT